MKDNFEDVCIPFNRSPYLDIEEEYLMKVVKSGKISGDGEFTELCSSILQKKTSSAKVLLTTSCTHALEMSAILCNIKEDDEVIMPSYTFASTADAFVGRGAKIVFVDIRCDTMNIDEKKIEEAITNKTKAIAVVHYAGVACEMDTIINIAKKHNLFVVEDAAHCIGSTYKDKVLGSIGDFGCYSFHETKNYSMGEGGAILLNSKNFVERAEIIREKGTNRKKFFRGQVDKYTWVDFGSSYLPSELNAAYLYEQLLNFDKIKEDRISSWNYYYKALKELADRSLISLPFIPFGCTHDAHMFYIKTKDLTERTKLIEEFKFRNILAVFHYVPLHSSPAGKRFGRFHGKDIHTTKESERLLRLPMYYGLSQKNVTKIVDTLYNFYKK
ncbi:MAG: dTDP-4-amino-4,6-dideoxygalactose transaminase [Endomicrobium sp.]|jgi:dTDP-4-amino-4,6-dideoxygalactose transaminase|nr:dTDP-4-amino-4,6-dideoxygalactose transaminase [Endomicrobium sp.]